MNQQIFGVELYPTIFDKAAYLWYTFSNYHCFYNGNKRTALVTTYIFLRVNGYCLNINSNFYAISLKIVESNLGKEEIKKIIQQNTIEFRQISIDNILEQLEKEINKNNSFKDVIINLSLT
ncbi:type II toxin-antitoxin system death-on-curing family toxin [Carnobacterium gallinarum]|uniref:type II toxin-antitoxin system death-on-curing family toxin n=1 Tax=Carnobacterium gallinarum TaxID=2749 RepID=UPI0006906C6F|nr:type II toxin-antitoxin system death-on-curing family toxin [Carnobacterium gallinarum]